MEQQSTSNLKEALNSRLAEMASLLADEGREFNRHLLRQFEEWEISEEQASWSVVQAEEHLLLLKAVAHTLGWLESRVISRAPRAQDGRAKRLCLPRLYFQCLLEARAGTVSDVGARLHEVLQDVERGITLKRPRRLLGVIAGLQTRAEVPLPNSITTSGCLDLETLQRAALDAGGRAMWTALAPLKLYGLHRGLAPRDILPPMGSAVSRGIERTFGFSLAESRNDYTVSHALHLKLADLAQASIWDINSGFYRMGGGACCSHWTEVRPRRLASMLKRSYSWGIHTCTHPRMVMVEGEWSVSPAGSL